MIVRYLLSRVHELSCLIRALFVTPVVGWRARAVMAEITVLMVAEKPSIAAALADALSPDGASKRKGASPRSPVYEYKGTFRGRAAKFRVTATTGHIYSLDFSQECNDWQKVQPGDLFHAPTIRCYDPSARMPEHIRQEANGSDVLVLWLDCDREGENICFEVIGEAQQAMSQRYPDPEAYNGCIWRAQFSSLAAQDLQQAMQNLVHPDIRQSHSVDARQEIDLRLGVAFSRLQTSYFRKHFGNQLGRKMVTYGPCQFPTLWFCVKRYCEIDSFVPVPFWSLGMTITIDGKDMSCHSKAGPIWDNADAESKAQTVRAADQSCRLKQARQWRSKIGRPLPLNTVAMLRMASDELGIGPGDTMHYAEQLYLKGIMSYPRTETDKYPQNFDLEGTVRTLSKPDAPWATHAQQILYRGIVEPRDDGFDAGDHPPITPVKFTASQSQCGGQAGWVLYQAICTHFLATVSPDCLFDEAELQLEIAGELFVTRSSRCVQKGWMAVDNRDTSDEGIVDLRPFVGQEGQMFVIQQVQLTEDRTRPPAPISESELLGLMEKYGIGTDASMAQHVSNVQKRQYVDLDESTRRMSPSALGLALAHAYALIDLGLLLPSVRARIENGCSRIAKGEATKEQVVRSTIRVFEKKFHNFAMRIDRVPMMLAIAYARERGSNLVAGGAAEQGLAMWNDAAKIHASITLDGLLEEKGRVELDDDDGGDIPEASEATRHVEQHTEAVQTVQEALEQLGFGSPLAEPQPKAKAKAKGKAQPNPEGPPEQYAPPAPPPPPGIDVGLEGPPELQVLTLLQRAGGTISWTQLSNSVAGLKKADLKKMAGLELKDSPDGVAMVSLNTSAPSSSGRAADFVAATNISHGSSSRGKDGPGDRSFAGNKGKDGPGEKSFAGHRGKDGPGEREDWDRRGKDGKAGSKGGGKGGGKRGKDGEKSSNRGNGNDRYVKGGDKGSDKGSGKGNAKGKGGSNFGSQPPVLDSGFQAPTQSGDPYGNAQLWQQQQMLIWQMQQQQQAANMYAQANLHAQQPPWSQQQTGADLFNMKGQGGKGW